MELIILLLALAIPVRAQFCPSCIQNSAVSQNAQFNVSSATIRGNLTVGNLQISSMTVSTMTAGVFIGSGTYLTNLSADQVISGNISSNVISGNYPGITGVGTLGSGAWQGNPVGVQYGGTGKNFIAVSTGSLLYFSGNGQISTLSPGTQGLQVLQTQGNAAPVWVSSPQISGANFYGIPLVALSSGTLPDGLVVSSGNIVGVNGANVLGNIPGLSSGITGTLSQTSIATGTLSSLIPASSITVTGVSPGVYGSPSIGTGVQLQVGTDGRIYSISQSSMTIPAAQVSAGTFSSGVLVPAASISSGTLFSGVVASSVASNGVMGGSYGGAAIIPGFTVDNSGRLTKVSTVSISIPASAINTNIPITSLSTGIFSTAQTASSITVTGVSPGVYGDSTTVPVISIGADGRITSASNQSISGASPSGPAGGALNGNYPNPEVAATGVTAATYGGISGNQISVPVIAVNAGGQITSASQATYLAITTAAAVVNAPNPWSAAQTFPAISASTITANLFALGPSTQAFITSTPDNSQLFMTYPDSQNVTGYLNLATHGIMSNSFYSGALSGYFSAQENFLSCDPTLDPNCWPAIKNDTDFLTPPGNYSSGQIALAPYSATSGGGGKTDAFLFVVTNTTSTIGTENFYPTNTSYPALIISSNTLLDRNAGLLLTYQGGVPVGALFSQYAANDGNGRGALTIYAGGASPYQKAIVAEGDMDVYASSSPGDAYPITLNGPTLVAGTLNVNDTLFQNGLAYFEQDAQIIPPLGGQDAQFQVYDSSHNFRWSLGDVPGVGGEVVQENIAPSTMYQMNLNNQQVVFISSITHNTEIGNSNLPSSTLSVDNSGANAFAVNGSTFSVSNGNVGVGTASPTTELDVDSPANMTSIHTSSGIVIGSGCLTLGGSIQCAGANVPAGGFAGLAVAQTFTAQNNFTADVNFSTSAVLSGIHVASFTAICNSASCSGSNLNLGPAIFGSTVNFTANGTRIMCAFNGACADSVTPASGIGIIGVFINGVNPTGAGNIGYSIIADDLAGDGISCSMLTPPITVAAGSSVTAYLSAANSVAGTWTIFDSVSSGLSANFGCWSLP